MHPTYELLALLLRRQSHHLNNVLTRLSGQLSLAVRDRERPEKLDGRFTKMEAASRGIADGIRILHQVARFEAEASVENDLPTLKTEIETLLTSPDPARARFRVGTEDAWTGPLMAFPGRVRLVLFAATEALATVIGGEGSLELTLEKLDDRVIFRWTAPSHERVVEALAAPFGELARELVSAPGWILDESTDGDVGVLRLEIRRP